MKDIDLCTKSVRRLRQMARDWRVFLNPARVQDARTQAELTEILSELKRRKHKK